LINGSAKIQNPLIARTPVKVFRIVDNSG
jgi:hypothetical protein